VFGRELGLTADLVNRHPFPGPRAWRSASPGDITKEKLDLLRAIDAVTLDEIHKAGSQDAIWQAFAVLLPVRRSSRATTAELPACRNCSNK